MTTTAKVVSVVEAATQSKFERFLDRLIKCASTDDLCERIQGAAEFIEHAKEIQVKIRELMPAGFKRRSSQARREFLSSIEAIAVQYLTQAGTNGLFTCDLVQKIRSCETMSGYSPKRIIAALKKVKGDKITCTGKTAALRWHCVGVILNTPEKSHGMRISHSEQLSNIESSAVEILEAPGFSGMTSAELVEKIAERLSKKRARSTILTILKSLRGGRIQLTGRARAARWHLANIELKKPEKDSPHKKSHGNFLVALEEAATVLLTQANAEGLSTLQLLQYLKKDSQFASMADMTLRVYLGEVRNMNTSRITLTGRRNARWHLKCLRLVQPVGTKKSKRINSDASYADKRVAIYRCILRACGRPLATRELNQWIEQRQLMVLPLELRNYCQELKSLGLIEFNEGGWQAVRQVVRCRPNDEREFERLGKLVWDVEPCPVSEDFYFKVKEFSQYFEFDLSTVAETFARRHLERLQGRLLSNPSIAENSLRSFVGYVAGRVDNATNGNGSTKDQRVLRTVGYKTCSFPGCTTRLRLSSRFTHCLGHR